MSSLKHRDFDTVTASEWREASLSEREELVERQRKAGIVSFRCLGCGFPTVHGQAACESCRPENENADEIGTV